MDACLVLDRNNEAVLDFDTEVEANEFIQLNESKGFHLRTVTITEFTKSKVKEVAA